MTNERVLEKAIEKVVMHGYKLPKDIAVNQPEHIIFSHDFALAFARYIQADKRNGGDLNEKLGCLFSCWWGDIRHRSDEELDMIVNDFLIDLALERDKLKYLAQFL